MSSPDPWIKSAEPVLPRPGTRVAAALSGGMDSTLAAKFLLEHGCDVLAFHLLLSGDERSSEPAQDAARLLGLDLEILDLRSDFEKRVVEPFVQGYAQGRTPNPCVLCNPAIKFGLLWEHARKRGAERLATGHYARRLVPPAEAGAHLARARDRVKDQSYFLCRLPRTAIAAACFPLAELKKAEVLKQALALGWRFQAESQDICFLAGRSYADFVLSRLPAEAVQLGEIVDTRGRVLGRHRGLIHYTVGQRRGLSLAGPEPYYVLFLQPETNRVVIGAKAEAVSPGLVLSDLVFSRRPPGKKFEALVQIRSRHRPALARVTLGPNEGRAEAVFLEPQPAVTPGQAAALYDGDVLMGGGWIEAALGA
jgi:tRNA-specific 2-thiouridylase